jgi:hypothetical protein
MRRPPHQGQRERPEHREGEERHRERIVPRDPRPLSLPAPPAVPVLWIDLPVAAPAADARLVLGDHTPLEHERGSRTMEAGAVQFSDLLLSP